MTDCTTMDQQSRLAGLDQRPPEQRRDEVYIDSCLQVEHRRYFAAVKGTPLTLTRTEFQLLSCLAGNIGRIVSVEELWAFAWKPNKPFNRKSVHVFMSRVRHKLVPFGLKVNSVVCVGYILSHDTCCANENSATDERR